MDNQNHIIKPKKHFGKLFTNVPFWLLIGLIFLLPIFFLPVSYGNLLFSKQLIFSGITFIVLIFTLLSFLKKGKIKYLEGYLFKTSGLVLITTLLAALFSGSIKLSMFGQGFEMDVWLSIFAGFSAIFMVALFFNSKEKVFYGYLALLVPVIILALFHILRFIFGSTFLGFGLFNSATSNSVGRFSDMGILFGLVLIMTLVILELFKLKGLPKILSYILLVVSLIFLVVTNVSFVWIIIGLFSLVLTVYLISFAKYSLDQDLPDEATEKENDKNLLSNSDTIKNSKINYKKSAPKLVILVLLISIIAYLSGGFIENNISSLLNINKLDIRPNWRSTLQISSATLQNDPLFGVGLNKFSNQWALYKDPSVNIDFWDLDFDQGVSFISTFAATSGTLGILSWILFIVSFVWLGIKAIFSPIIDKIGRFLTLISFTGASFMWLSAILYVPGTTIMSLTFILTGLFLASLINEGLLKIKELNISDNSKKNFIGSLILILSLIIILVFGYVLTKNYGANLVFQKGLYEANVSGNLDKAESLFNKAVSWSNQDVYYRVLTDVGLTRVSGILSSLNGKDTDISDDERLAFQTALGVTLNYANKAVELDNKNYQNWLNIGGVYEAIVPLGVDGAYQNARGAYEQAVMLNPINPGLRLVLARLEVTNKNNDAARDFIAQALSLKPNYTDAAYLLSQIEIQENNTKGAIESLKSASLLSPNDPMVFFRLGLLQYDNKSYKDAVSSLSMAVKLNPLFANARYFLGLSFEKVRDDASAIEQFEQIKLTNPNNQEVDKILANLKAGKYALDGISNAPQSREEPPIDENETDNE